VPLPFHLTYDPAQIKPGHSYAISARIEENGQLMFITTERHSVAPERPGFQQPIRVRVDQIRPMIAVD
jgi:putative lipoprotein